MQGAPKNFREHLRGEVFLMFLYMVLQSSFLIMCLPKEIIVVPATAMGYIALTIASMDKMKCSICTINHDTYRVSSCWENLIGKTVDALFIL